MTMQLAEDIPTTHPAALQPLPCPFCGEQPTVKPWHGGGPRKTMVECESGECPAGPSSVGSSRARAVRKWNTRAS